MSEGRKFDGDKIPLDLIPTDSLMEIGKVLREGAKKYDRANWANGLSQSRLISAAMRHMLAFNNGEDVDEETKTLHLANAATNMIFAIWMHKNRPDMDDRWVKLVKKPELKPTLNDMVELVDTPKKAAQRLLGEKDLCAVPSKIK